MIWQRQEAGRAPLKLLSDLELMSLFSSAFIKPITRLGESLGSNITLVPFFSFFGLLVAAIGLTLTYQAATTTTFHFHRLWCIRMPVLAMITRSIQRVERISTQLIYEVRHCFQMSWINTGRIPTEMINLQLERNRTFVQFIGETMCGLPTSIDAERAVSFFGLVCSPYPALSESRSMLRDWTILIDLLPKSLFGWSGRWHSTYTITGGWPAPFTAIVGA